VLEKFGLRHRFRPPIEKELQELEGFWGKWRGLSMAKDQAPARVELALSKDHAHKPPQRIRVS
jgi:hypothetical protein